MSRVLLSILFISLFVAVAPAQSVQAAGPVSVQTDAGTFTLEVDINPNGVTALLDVPFTAELKAGDGILKISGTFSSGELAGGMLSGHALGGLEEAYQSSRVDSTLTISQAGVDLYLEQGVLLKGTLAGADIDLELLIEGKQFSLGGISDAQFGLAGVSFNAPLSVEYPFDYEKGNVSATLEQDDPVNVTIAGSDFKGALFSRLDLVVEIPTGNGSLTLGGSVGAGMRPDYTIDIDATLEVIDDFMYEKGPVSATLKSGDAVNVVVEGSKFTQAQFLGLDVVVDIPIGNGKLKLGGSVDNGTYKPGDGISFTARLHVLEPFQYNQGPVSATLNSDDSVSVTVEASEFQGALFSGLDVVVDIETGGGKLKLGGSVDNGTYKPGDGITFTARLDVLEPFQYEKGEISASLKQGGAVTVVVEGSQFKHVQLSNLDVSLNLLMGGDGLKIGGSVDGEYKPDGGISFIAPLTVLDPFQYMQGDVSASLKPGGKLSVVVERSEFKYAELRDVELRLEVRIGDSMLRLGGKVDASLDENGQMDFDGGLTLGEDFGYVKGSLKARLTAGSYMVVRVRDSRFLRAVLTDQPVAVELQLPGSQTAVLTGVISKGSITRRFMTFRAQVLLESQVVIQHRLWRRIIEPGKGTLTLLPSLATFSGEGGRFSILLPN